MTPDRILEALKQLVLAALAFATSLGGAAGGLPAHPQPNANAVREVLSVPRLPSEEILLVDQVDETETGDTEDEEGEDDLEEIDPEELDAPLQLKAIVLRGPISARPEDGVIGTWTVAGRDVEVTETTVVSTRAANAVVGDWAQVQALVQAPEDDTTGDDTTGDDTTGDDTTGEGEEELVLDTLVARSVSVMSSRNMGRVVGIIQSIGEEDETGASTWVVSGVSVTVDGSTHIVGTPEEGRLADVHGSMTIEEPATEDETTSDTGDTNDNDNETLSEESGEDETANVGFVAKLVVVRGTANLPKEERQQEKVQKQSAFRIQGEVESIDEEAGAWVIGGQTVQVSETTSIDEKKGTAEVGAQVRVLAQQDEDGNLVALEIEVLKAKVTSKSANKSTNKVQKQSAFRIQGAIESIDADAGAWVVNGQTLQVSTATTINEKKGAAVAGVQVRVLAQRDENGSLVALEIEVLQAKGGNKAANQAKPAKDNPGQAKKK